MKISKTGLKLIEQFEGLRLKAYKDAVGIWTIGYGHTRGVAAGQTITKAQAEEFLRNDCAKAEAAVMKYYSTYKWNQNQFDALVSFAFNIGNIDGLTAKGTRSVGVIAQKILLYNKAGSKVLAGLTKRRQAEAKLFTTPVKTKSVSNDTIAREVIAGKWGNGDERKAKLKAAGYDPVAIQKLVNKLLK